MESRLSVAEASRLLGVSRATVRNWLRLGRIKSLHSNDIRLLKAEIDSGKGRLKSRRNKTALRGGQVYSGYIRANTDLAALFGHGFNENQIRVILAEAALRLFSDGENLLLRFLEGKLPCAGADHLISDLLGDSRPDEKTAAILEEGWRPDKGQDVLGFIYMSLLPLNLRRSRGAYYTPPIVVEKAISRLGTVKGVVLDPCCGSGNFLLELCKTVSPLDLRAADVDPIAVALARINLYSRYPDLGTDYLYKNIVNKSFFDLEIEPDAIIGNPPWGGSPEPSALFLDHSLKLLKNGGVLSLVLPEALLSVKKHAPIRAELLSKAALLSVDYLGERFHSVNCPSVVLTAKKGGSGTEGCRVNGKFTIRTERGGDLRCLNLNVTDEEYAVVRRMAALKNAVRLKDNARFALGIVTGGNTSVLKDEPFPGAEPIIRGLDVSPFSVERPQKYVKFDPAAFQQCAPEEVYRAPEKIVYRFIGRRPVFAVDRERRLTLNSCNIIVPRIEGLSIDYITKVLNSKAAGFFLEKSFDSKKWLRWHLEEIPIPVVSAAMQGEIINAPDWQERIWKLYLGGKDISPGMKMQD